MDDLPDSEAAMKDDGFLEPPDAPKKAPIKKPSAQVPAEATEDVPKASTNTYVVKRGDHPFKVAEELYGQGSLGRELVLANPDSKWKPGDVLKLL